MEEQEIKDLSKKHFFEGQNENELAIARIGFVEGYKQAQPKWIDVNDRLPETPEFYKKHVLVHFDLSKSSSIAYYHEKEWVVIGMQLTGKITHWMPLPKPPNSAMS